MHCTIILFVFRKFPTYSFLWNWYYIWKSREYNTLQLCLENSFVFNTCFIRLHLGFKPYIWLHFCSLMFKNRVQYNIRIHLYTAAGDGNMLKFDMNLFSWSISIASQRLTSCTEKLHNILNDYFIGSKVASIFVLM